MSAKPNEQEKKINFQWLPFALGGLIFSGGTGIVQKEFRAVNPCPMDEFLFFSFGFACLFNALFTCVFYLVERKKTLETTNEYKAVTARDFIVSATVLGGIMGMANLLNTYLAGVFTSVITYPVVNGGRILLTSALVPFLFKEKTSRMQKTGIILGFIAILLIALA